MNCVTYVDLHRQVSLDIEAELETALLRLAPTSGAGAAKSAVSRLLRHQKLRHPLSVLPMMVHAIETGDPGPAVPLSAVHVLWWTSACYLDDLADGHGTTASDSLSQNEALLASVLSGAVLPIQIIRSLPVSAAVQVALTAEIATGWVVGTEGQLTDIDGDADGATRNSVVEAYRGKSGGPFSMITAMAAILSGASDERVELWREFGYIFGILWQLFNDQEDILSGRNEDLLNGTVTYLLTCVLEEAGTPGAREDVLGWCAAARNSEEARAELTRLLLAPAVLDQYTADLDAFRAEAHRLLTTLDGDAHHVPGMRHLVDHAAQMLLQTHLVPAAV
ncbi:MULTISPECIES: polyprenyl synthetase family protein [unclassified Streptomyces]|uniref:polyprenyl synthetase family protein n=1 Tax=unclassified Streptomyces TaxID=2593676 RepID=UPI00224E5E1E|nr:MULTISPECIES: polyprenyl synthetase family protein [unclassified Streptomyces]MCX5147979.1 polyprenyl synthetase family protein [Streptomyces sp. NBC_00320]WSN51069.1 polyprenyl synthetase family protein [Streptomyces sp. NBC_01296]